jgi:hypothetical protein
LCWHLQSCFFLSNSLGPHLCCHVRPLRGLTIYYLLCSLLLYLIN